MLPVFQKHTSPSCSICPPALWTVALFFMPPSMPMHSSAPSKITQTIHEKISVLRSFRAQLKTSCFSHPSPFLFRPYPKTAPLFFSVYKILLEWDLPYLSQICDKDTKPLFHSDRGYQYTSKSFRKKLNKAGMTQSMSRVSRCIDNGPMEAFWEMLKSEMYYLKKFQTYEELKEAISDYIDCYNNHRYQKRLNCMTPIEYRNYLKDAA